MNEKVLSIGGMILTREHMEKNLFQYHVSTTYPT
jgi:hypothetical protein